MVALLAWVGAVGLDCGKQESQDAATAASSGSAMPQCTNANVEQTCGKSDSCKLLRCDGGACKSYFTAKGTKCTEDMGEVCDGMGKCVAMHCADGILDGDETDVDCGGSCMPCALGKQCGKNDDCGSGYCGMINGGAVCKACSADADCSAGKYCDATKACVAAKGPGVACAADHECGSGHCADGVCCDKACADGCDVCAQKLGASADGTCTADKAGDAGVGCGNYVCDGASAACPKSCASDQSCAAGAFCNAQKTCQPDLPINGCTRAKAIDVSGEASPFNIRYDSSVSPTFTATIKGSPTTLTFPLCLKVKAMQAVNACVNPPTCSMATPLGGPLLVGGTVDKNAVSSYDDKSPIQPLCFGNSNPNGAFDVNSPACYTGGQWPCGLAGVPACNNANQNAWVALSAYPFYNNSDKATQDGVLYIVP